jgi:hypothetical protein
MLVDLSRGRRRPSASPPSTARLLFHRPMPNLRALTRSPFSVEDARRLREAVAADDDARVRSIARELIAKGEMNWEQATREMNRARERDCHHAFAALLEECFEPLARKNSDFEKWLFGFSVSILTEPSEPVLLAMNRLCSADWATRVASEFTSILASASATNIRLFELPHAKGLLMVARLQAERENETLREAVFGEGPRPGGSDASSAGAPSDEGAMAPAPTAKRSARI